jgi:hypothetical protein
MEFLEIFIEAFIEFGVVGPICGLLADWKHFSPPDFNKLPLSGRDLITLK